MVHIDDAAIAAVSHVLEQLIPPNSHILDLMSSWRSHLPKGLETDEVVGLGMNQTEDGGEPSARSICDP